MNDFAHLRLHSEFSLSDGIVRIKNLAEQAASQNMPAVAITDIMNIYGSVKFYRACVAHGIKPLIGTEINLVGPRKSAIPFRLTLLCRNEQGFKFVNHLLTRAYLEPRHSVHVTVQREWLRGNEGNVIALSCGLDGELGNAILSSDQREVDELADEYLGIFGDNFYLDIHRYGVEREQEYNFAAIDLGERKGIPVVATNPVQFLNETDFDSHDVRVCINEGRVVSDTRRARNFTNQQYLKDSAAMQELFSDVPQAVSNSVLIAQRCNVFMDFSTSYMPAFPTGPEQTSDQLLIENSRQGLQNRLSGIDLSIAKISYTYKDYEERLEQELDVILGMGFPGYFLIVADFIQWAKNMDIPVGPGRGSGAGSVVAWVLGITDLDPLKYGLLFERFLNPERVSLPDFDIDFCMNRRDEVIEYVADRYGKNQVSQIITFGTMAAKAVVRDVGRVLGHPYGFVDSVAKMVPFEIGITLSKALEQEEELRLRYENEEEVTELIDSARMLEGLARNVGKHAGGVVIAPNDLSDFVPLFAEPGMPQPVTQFDKDDLESIGLVKFDFLGLRTLTVIHSTMKMVNIKRQENPLNIDLIPLDDAKTFTLIKAGKTTGIFQLESRGMKEIIVQLLPDQFEDLIALVALYRPGPLQSGMVEDFINRKHGREKIVYPHGDLEEILKPTYGVILYQEQVMQIAQVLSGYTLGSADLLRRAMGKKKAEEMAKQREAFVQGAEARNVEAETSGYIFDLVEKFAGYGFNKSHSAAYALLTYQTAWLKTHFPAEFMSASLTADMENTDKVVTLISESRSMGLNVLPPDINRCHSAFTPHAGDTVIYGLGALKGVGDKAINGMVEERFESGDFVDIFDLCRRIDSKKINKRVLEALVRGGALDCFGLNRASLMNGLPTAMNAADKHGKDRDSGQNDMFGLATVEKSDA
ncbi:MAG: DNA polymerase-3 subunit alpha, partial [Gammaproteobacteria bacterium]